MVINIASRRYILIFFSLSTFLWRSIKKASSRSTRKMTYELFSHEDKDPDLEQGDIEIEVERESDFESEHSTIYTPFSFTSTSTSTSPAPDKQQKQQQQRQQNEPQPQPDPQSEPQSHPQSESESQTQVAVYRIHYYSNKVLDCSFWDLTGFVLAFVLLVILGVIWVVAVRNAD